MKQRLLQRLSATVLSTVVLGATLASNPTLTYATQHIGVAASADAVRAGVGVPEGLRGRGIEVAVIDTGVVPLPMFGTRLTHGPDFSSDAALPNLNGLDAFGHGTNIAGIVAGVAPEARIVSVKVASSDGSTSAAKLVRAVNWVIANATTNGRNIRVLNLSFGLPQGSSSPDLADALRRAWRSGIVVVASAGNDGEAGVTAPATEQLIIAAGAVDIGSTPFTPAAFTACGKPLHRQPDLLAPGVGIVGPRVPGSYLDQHYPQARVGRSGFRGSGTSQAAATLSGIAALLIGERPGLTPAQTKALLLSNAVMLPDVSTSVQGRGVISAGAASAATPLSVQDAESSNRPRPLIDPGAFTFPGSTLEGYGWNGIEWSGNRWSGNRWSGNRWSGSAWV